MKFTKMSGAGNDFVVLEARPGMSGPALARRLCDRRAGIGADGLVLLEPPKRGAPARMRYFNADGSRAFCANGSRCAAVWMHARGWAPKRFSFAGDRGRLDAVVTGPGRARLRMPAAEAPRAETARAFGVLRKGWLLDTGVPHFVVPVRDLGRADVAALGRALRFHPRFAPEGVNVDFVQWTSPVSLRTYERGVEAETLACGSGAVAAALCAAAFKGKKFPVALRTRGGQVLKVHMEEGRPWLEGPAVVTFEGETAGV